MPSTGSSWFCSRPRRCPTTSSTRGWRSCAAISRKIRETKRVEDGVPLSILSAGMPENLLLSYRRDAEWVMVFDSPVKNKRKIWATKNIG